MLHILLLAVQALPAYVPYNDQVVPIDYDSATGRLAVGTQEKYVSKVVEAARWANLTSVNQPVGRHIITGWRAGKHTKGVYLTHTTDGQNWKTYVPDIDNFSAVTAANLDSLLAMYNVISQSPGMQTKDLVDFVVPQAVKSFLETEADSKQEIIPILPALRLMLRALQKTKQRLMDEARFQVCQKTRETLLALNMRMFSLAQKSNWIINTELTKEVALALKSSNPDEVKAFLESLLENEDFCNWRTWNDLIPTLAEKIGSVTSLDLNQARPQLLMHLLQKPAFIPLITSPVTLSTISTPYIFHDMINILLSLSQPDQNGLFLTVVKVHPELLELLDIESHRMLLRVIVPTIQENQSVFDKNCNNLLEIINSKNGYTIQAMEDFFNKPENQELLRIIQEESKNPVNKMGLSQMRRQTAQDFAAELGVNQEKWKELLKLLNDSQERERVFRAQQTAAFVNVATEMKRRFDVAEQAEKGGLAAVAKRVWTPDYPDAAERQTQIRAISPQAAQMLEKMASVSY